MIVAGVDVGPGEPYYFDVGGLAWEYRVAKIFHALRDDCFFVWEMGWNSAKAPTAVYGKHVAKREIRDGHPVLYESAAGHYESLPKLIKATRAAAHKWVANPTVYHVKSHNFKVLFTECDQRERR